MKAILFNTEMAQAILAGRKTQTRRPIKPRYKDDECGFNVCTNKATGEQWVEKMDEDEGGFNDTRYVNPLYKKGDILYVRETWQEVFETEYDSTAEGYCVDIRKRIVNFDDIPKTCMGLSTDWSCAAMTPRNKYYVYKACDIKYADGNNLHWRPSIHMPKEAARIFLKVTGVRVERAQDICGQGHHDDASKEGIEVSEANVECGYTAIHKFRDTWDSIYGNWAENPWVWVVEFERCEKEKQDE